MTSVLDTLQSTFLKIIADIKYHPWPLFVIYDPKGFQVKGYEIRTVINTVQPGDIILRGYDRYLSDLFIPGYFTHAALYVGEVADDALDKLEQPFTPEQKQNFNSGEQMVIHAMAQGVFMEDIIDFCRCDRLMILRFPETLGAPSDLKSTQQTGPATDTFNTAENAVYHSLRSGGTLKFSDVFPIIYQSALSQIGKPYDFKFNFGNYNDLSCTEYVQSCIKALAPFHGITATEKHYFGPFKKSIILPDAFLKGCFDRVWQSHSTDLNKIPYKMA